MDLFQTLLTADRASLWHPYSSINDNAPLYPVTSAKGVRLTLADGRKLVDGMSSWWSAIHGYNHPKMNQALIEQLQKMSHVMFGGLTHSTAVELAQTLIDITPDQLNRVFFSDSGSVSVEVALKMAIQYWHAKHQPNKQHFLSLRNGYHGDTFGAMSVCDPVTGMHQLFNQSMTQQIFIESPQSHFNEACLQSDIDTLDTALKQHHQELAAMILEPVVQGAGGMRFYSADYLNHARELCDQYGVLLIFDEIATGFGRTGKLFATEHSNIQPDIMCIGKALTGGYLSLAATLCNEDIAHTISQGEPGVFMHGPTFMANPLACSAANASIRLLLNSNWPGKISQIEDWLKRFLLPCNKLASVKDVRVLGAIGVVECTQEVDMNSIQPALVDQGVWIRPFGRLVYIMPPYVINQDDTQLLCDSIYNVLQDEK